MKITIDNLDGEGAVDYTAALSADAPFTIERVLNTPSRCTGALDVGNPANPGAAPVLRVPVRRGRVVVSAENGTILFTGYLATEPAPIYVGVGLAGPVYRVAFAAISDEWLLDKQTLTLTGAGFVVAGGTLLSTLTTRTDARLDDHLRSRQRQACRRLYTRADAALVHQRRRNRELHLRRLPHVEWSTRHANRRLRHTHAGLRFRRVRWNTAGRGAANRDGQGVGQRCYAHWPDRTICICN